MLATVRASVSVRSKKLAPSNNDVGSNKIKLAPTNNRAICGTSKPTQPIIPVMETALAVQSVVKMIKI